MFQFNLSTWVQNNFWRIFSFNAFLCFLLLCLVIKKEGKKIYHSLAKEKLKIFWQVVCLLFFLTIIHFALKYFFPYQADKIKELVVAIDINRSSFWRLVRIFFGLCVFAPIIEECVYRYLVFNIFGKKNPISYLISFSVFILAHYCWRGESIRVLFLQYSLASFGLIYIYKKSNWNLLAPILLHSLVNLLFITIVIINPTCSLI